MGKGIEIYKGIFDCSIGKNLNDKTDRDWLIVGSSDDFAILQRPDRINKIL